MSAGTSLPYVCVCVCVWCVCVSVHVRVCVPPWQTFGNGISSETVLSAYPGVCLPVCEQIVSL